jgi:hypothetical protein
VPLRAEQHQQNGINPEPPAHANEGEQQDREERCRRIRGGKLRKRLRDAGLGVVLDLAVARMGLPRLATEAATYVHRSASAILEDPA